MLNDISAPLNALVAELTRRGSPLERFLRPGLGADDVRSKMMMVGAQAHADVISLYAWHDGIDRFSVPTSPNGIVSLVPSHKEFNPLDETLALFSRWREMAESDAFVPVRGLDGSWTRLDPNHIWSRSWFPVFEGGGSEVIFVSSDRTDPGSVWLDPVQDVPQRLFDSLADAADAVRVALTAGRLELDETGVYTLESTLAAGLQL